MATESKSGWYAVQLKDNAGNPSGKSILQVKGEALSRGLHQAALQYHRSYEQDSDIQAQEIFVLITNIRISEDHIIVTTPKGDIYNFTVYPGGLLYDMPGEPEVADYSPVTKLVELMELHDKLKISQGRNYFTINTTGFTTD